MKINARDLLKPKYYPLWCLYFVFYLLSRLPKEFIYKIGHILGIIAYKYIPKKVALAKKNISLCFPNLNEQELNKLVKEHFIELGHFLMETALAYTNPKRKVDITFKGDHHLQAALKEKKGAIILYAHFTLIDIGMKTFHQSIKNIKLSAVYTPASHPFFEYLQQKGRGHYLEFIEKQSPRKILRALKNNKAIFFLPDLYMSQHKKHLDLPFLGHHKNILTTCSDLARITQTKIIPLITKRNKDLSYTQELLPPLENFPSDNIQEDTTKIKNYIEKQIKKYPSQYFWYSNQFSLQPEEYLS
ncbi:MAG: hypothetical protein VW378_00325 [bacterium]